MESEVYRHIRAEKELNQRELAQLADTTQSTIARFESGTRSLSSELRTRLDYLLGLGGPDPEPARPIYLLALMGDAGPVAFLGDDDGRFGAFADRDLADTSADLLRQLGLEGAAVVPAWPSWLGERLAAGRSKPPPKFEGGSYLLDDADPEIVREQTTHFLMELVRALQADTPEPVHV